MIEVNDVCECWDLNGFQGSYVISIWKMRRML